MAAKSARMAFIRTDTGQRSALSALFRLVLGLLFDGWQRHGLLEGLPYFLQTFLMHVMDALAALGRKVDQLVVTHGAALPGER